MPINIEDTGLQDALEKLGARQDVPVKKTTMAYAILEAAVEAVRRSDDPRAWRPSNVDLRADGPVPGG